MHQTVAKGESREHRAVTSDDKGTARFDGLETGSGIAYRVTVPVDGATFAAMPFQLGQTKGMHVVSAGSDARLPPGLVIGTVSDSSRSSTANHWRVEVTPLRVAEACETLLVLRFANPPR